VGLLGHASFSRAVCTPFVQLLLPGIALHTAATARAAGGQATYTTLAFKHGEHLSRSLWCSVHAQGQVIKAGATVALQGLAKLNKNHGHLSKLLCDNARAAFIFEEVRPAHGYEL